MEKIDKINEIQYDKTLIPAIRLLSFYKNSADVENCIRVQKRKIAEKFNVSEHTVGNWIKRLSSADVIKYKYFGLAMLNPNLFYQGENEINYRLTLAKWNNFKNDIGGN